MSIYLVTVREIVYQLWIIMFNRIVLYFLLSIGSFVWPVATRSLIDHYGFRGAYLLIGGIMFNGMVFAALIRPAPVKRVYRVIIFSFLFLICTGVKV